MRKLIQYRQFVSIEMTALLKCTLLCLALAAFVTLTSCEEHSFEGRFQQPRSWVRCNYTENPGSSCNDCHSRLVCTRIGGFVIPCWWPGKNNCVDGECQAEPSEQCAPTTTQSPSSDATETPTSQSPTSDGTETPTSQSPSSNATEAPTSQSPPSDATEAPTTQSDDTESS